jgi:Family of unknown function (DUF6011)
MNNHLISSKSLLSVIRSEKENKGSNFTIKSKNTGKEFTFKISRSQYNGVWYTHVSVEREYMNWMRVGTFKMINGKGVITNKGQVVETPSSVSIRWVLTLVEKGMYEYVDERVEVYHTGHCIRCGRELTDTQSIQSGLGPICREY